MTAELILASSSPRRRELLALTGIPYTIDAPDVDEECDLPAREAVAEISRRKAAAAAVKHPGCVILAADTLVFYEDQPLGKPHDEEDACRMLRLLSNNWHHVCTGVTVIGDDGMVQTEVDESAVRFGPMTDEEIRRYIATGEPMDKAGAYAVQGIASMWIDEIRGCASGIIGLPLPLVRKMLARCGLQVLA